ncbi:hypothetical protein RB195_019486 [Necator americanus]|uniref:Uncharacterized protein n=1 Tax=Necator americanus TaxID=51031 RepID=A0ABR1CEE6_NECAM
MTLLGKSINFFMFQVLVGSHSPPSMYSHRHVEPLLSSRCRHASPLNPCRAAEPMSSRHVEPLLSSRCRHASPLNPCRAAEPMSSRCCICRAAAHRRLLLFNVVFMVNHLSSESVQRHESSTSSSGKTFACGHTPAVL